ncbi:uncharacterized protein abca12 [Paramisgurnus dabryanus]|uniref:uncharacterized protein abca12 n=1 Tax=Paramisgurnus dabryanus TaxID=90735 RepID=UPI0031F40A70
MASFFKQLRLLLWKNGLGVIRQPAWSVALLIWPLVIFIILAITRSQFPPKLKDTCYVAPRNLPSTGFFPFLQTLMCNTDSSCTNKSYLAEGQSRTFWHRGNRRRRDTESYSLPSLLEGLPSLAHLQKGGLVHSILKRDTSDHPELLEIWDRVLNSSLETNPNVTSFMEDLNNTAPLNQEAMEAIWESVSVLKKSICSFSLTSVNISNSSQADLFTNGLINFCKSNNTVLEATLLTMNQVLTDMLLNNPAEVLHTVGETVVVVDTLQTEKSVWDFLLGLPDVFLKPTDQEKLTTAGEELENLKKVLSFAEMILPQANVSTSFMNPVLEKGIGIFNYTSSWQGRDVYIKMSDIVTLDSILSNNTVITDLISKIQIPLDKVTVLLNENDFRTFLSDNYITSSYSWSWEAGQIFQRINKGKVAQQMLLAWSQGSSSADVAFVKELVSSFLGLVSPASSGGVSESSRPSRSTNDAEPRTLMEQIILGIGNTAFDLLRGIPGWEYIQTFLMSGHSSMQIASVAMEVQLPFIKLVLSDANRVQELFLSLAQNETFANAWADHVMDSVEQTLVKVFEGNTNCSDLYTPWAWMSAYISIDHDLWDTLVCSGNDTSLEQILMTSLSPVAEKVQQLVGIVGGNVTYNVTPSVMLAEWHQIFTTSSNYGAALQYLVTGLGQKNITAWITEQMPVHLSQILLTRGLDTIKTVGSMLENSYQWPSIEPYFNMAYWIMNYQPNVTTSPNCMLGSSGLTCQTGFTWETFVPLIQTMISEVSSNPAGLLRPIQGTVALLESVYQDTYMSLLQRVLVSNSSSYKLPQDLMMNLINTVHKEIQLLSNIESTEQFDTQLSQTLLNDILAALGLGQLEDLLSGGYPISSFNPVLQNLLQFLRNDSVQMLQNEGGFAVLNEVLSQLGAVLPPQQQDQLEAVLNYTHALIGDLEICSAVDHNCSNDVLNVFGLLNIVSQLSNDTNIENLALNSNMTLSVVGDVLSLILPWSMSLPPNSSMEIVSKVQHLLKLIYASTNANSTSITEALQLSNLTIYELQQISDVINIYNWSAVNTVLDPLAIINMIGQTPQCLNDPTILQSSQGPPFYGEADCVLQFIQTAVGSLPVAKEIQTTLVDWLNITAGELRNLSNPETDSLAMTEEVLTTTLSTIRQNLQSLHVDNMTMITGELDVLENLLKEFFNERYPYYTINSPMMAQGQYAQKVYENITLWYLNKLENATSGSTFAEILQPLIHMTKMHVELISSEMEKQTMIMNQIQNLIVNVKVPLDSEDLMQVGNTVMTILHGELERIKTNLQIHQALFDSTGSPVNASFPTEIEAQIMTYLNLTKDWITNPQLTTALAKIFQWNMSSIDITTPGIDLEHLIQAMAPLFPTEEQSFLAVADKVSQAVNYAIHVANTDGGLQSENFIKAIASTVNVVLESMSNETGPLPQDVIQGILGAFQGSLQLILNPNAQTGNLTQETINQVNGVMQALLPVEANQVLVPISNILFAYLPTFLQPGGPGNWTEVIPNVMTDLQDSLPSNSTAQSIVSMLLNVTDFILNPNGDNMTEDWIVNQLKSISNETVDLPLDVVHNILGCYYGFLQLIVNPNISFAEATNLTLDHAQKLDEVLHALLPMEATEVLVPIIDSFFSYLNNISQPGATDDWDEITLNMIEELQNSLPSNNTAQPIISMFLNITESFITVLDQIQVANTDNGLQSQNFIEVMISAVDVLLESVSNDTAPLPQDVIRGIFGAFPGLLQLILNPNMSSAQSGNLTQETINQVNGVMQALLPAEANQVLVPITNILFAYLPTFLQPGGPKKWHEMIPNVMTDLQDSLPSNSTSQSIVSMLLNVTDFILNPNGDNMTEEWIAYQLTSISNETVDLPLDVVHNILGCYYGFLQLFLNPNISFAEATNLTLDHAQKLDEVLYALLPVEATEVLVPITNSFFSYLNNISQPGATDEWDEITLNMIEELQNSLPLNNTAQPIISMFLNITESIITVLDQITPAVNYAVHVANTDHGLQSQNFMEAMISAVGVLLESVSNQTPPLPQDVIRGIFGAFHGSLQLILNPNMSNAQSGNLTQETINQVNGVMQALLPVEANEVLVPISNILFAYLPSFLQPGGPEKWHEMIPNVMTDLQDSLPSNSTSQSIVSMLLNVTDFILNPNGDNMTEDWIVNQLTSISNETVDLPLDVVHNILGCYYGFLQLIGNPNISFAEATNLTLDHAQKLDEVLYALLPGEATEVLIPITNSFFSYLNNISQPGATDEWDEITLNMIEELQSSLPLNNTAQPIISMFLNITESIITVLDQITPSVNYAVHVANIDNGLQSQNFIEAMISVLGVLLESVSNETAPLPQNVIHGIFGAFHGSLPLILNPNMSNAQTGNLTQEAIIQLNEIIQALLPAETNEVLVPISNILFAYLPTFLQPGGPGNWTEVIPNVMTDLQDSLQSNSTAQSIISMLLNVTDFILSPNGDNMTEDWIINQLTSISNETVDLPLDVVHNILGSYYGFLQLIVNPNMSYPEATNLTLDHAQKLDEVLYYFLPVEATDVLVPITDTLFSYLNNISQPAATDNWNEIVLNVINELQNSLPSNHTAQPIISMLLNITESILSSNEGNFTTNWFANQWNASFADGTTSMMELDQLIQSLLSPEEMAFFAISHQVSQQLNNALQVASTDGGLQSENFIGAIISAVSVALESMSNETGPLPLDGIVDALHGSLQLILNPNMSYAQANNVTQEIVQNVEEIIEVLLPAEANEVLEPITNIIFTYLKTVSRPGGSDKWNEVILNVLKEILDSLPSNSTSQSIMSVAFKVIEYVLSPHQGNINLWDNFGNYSLGNISEITEQLVEFISYVTPFMNESSETVTEAAAVLVQILSGNADQDTFDKLEKMLADLLSTFNETEMWESLPSVVSTMQMIMVNTTQNMTAQTDFFYTLQGPLSSLLTDIFQAVNASGFTVPQIVGGLPQALLSTTEVAVQAGLEHQSLNCSQIEQIWQEIVQVAGISEDNVVSWCNISLQPVIAAFNTPEYAATIHNMTEMDPLWVNATAEMIVQSLEMLYEAGLNHTIASEHLMETLLYYTSTLSNLSVSEITNLSDWNAQLYQSMSTMEMALDQIGTEYPWTTPYIEAIEQAMEYFPQSLLQNSTSEQDIVMHALEIVLTGMNFTEDSIESILGGNVHSNESTVDNIIKDVIQQIIHMELLGDVPVLYDIMQQALYLEDTSGILWKTVEFVNWIIFPEETGASFVIEALTKFYEILRQFLKSLPAAPSPLNCFSDTFIDIAGNVLYMMKQIRQTSELFASEEHYLNPLQMQLANGQNLRDLLSHTRSTRSLVSDVKREPIDDFLDLLDINYNFLFLTLLAPPTTTEILETVHVFFANPDLAVILKGLSGEMTSGQEETIDATLNALTSLTLPRNAETFLEMFMMINEEGLNLKNLENIQKLTESLGRMADVATVISENPSLNVAERIKPVAEQLQASVSTILSSERNGNTAVKFLNALNTILAENFQEIAYINPQASGILQNVIGPFSSPGSEMSVTPFLTAVDQTSEAFSSMLSGDEAVYFNISRQMLKAFALLEAYPRDINEVLLSTSLITDTLNNLLNLSGITTTPNGQPVEEVTNSLILSSALATQILFNLSTSNYNLINNAEWESLLTQTFNQMSAVLPTETHAYLDTVKSILFSSLSNLSSPEEIMTNFPEISQEVTGFLFTLLNVTYDTASTQMTPDNLTYILMTMSNQVSQSLYEGLTATDYPIQFSQVLNSSSNAVIALYSIMPDEGIPYLNMTVNLMETMSTVVNESSSGNVDQAVSLLVNTVNSLLAMVPHIDTNASSSIIGDLEQTLNAMLMILQMDQNPLTQTSDITQQLIHTIQNLILLGNNSMELDLAQIVLGAANMSIDHLLMINETNWKDEVASVVMNLANSLPDDLPYSSFIKPVMRSLANESQENLHLLLQVVNTAFEFGSANWMNDSSGVILDRLLTQVCALENMDSVKLISQSLYVNPKLLCNFAVPTIQAIRVLTIGVVNDSVSVYDLFFQTFVGDPSTYNTAVDWTSTLSQILGFNISSLTTLRSIDLPTPAEVKVSELLKNTTLFVEDVMQHTRFPLETLLALLDYPLPSSNLQFLNMLTDLQKCSDPSSLGLDPEGQAILNTFCYMPVSEWYTLTILLVRHVDMKTALFRLIISKEIQDLVGFMLQMLKFLTDMMSKLSPALTKLQGYLSSIGDLNLVANQEFHSLVRGKRSTMSSRATLSTVSRALCRNGILSLFAITKLPIGTDSDPSVQNYHEREQLIEKFKIPQNASPFCMNLYLDMVNTTGGAVAWAFLKPMLLGQVLYSPDTLLTREVIRKSNSTLNQFGDLKLYAAEWLQSSAYVMQSADILAKTLPILQNSLRSPFVQNFIQVETGIDVAQLSATLNQFSNMTVLLEKNKFIMDQITTLSNLMMNLSSCVNFDRYRGFNSSDDLDVQAQKLAQNRELYASVIFKLPAEPFNSSLPPAIDYTIRMNIENSMRTDRVRNPFWVKDAYISATNTMRYSRGFVYLQESIERSIIEMQTRKPMDGPAVQIQAFPYPCYYKDEYLNSIAFAFPMALMISWVLFVANFVKKLVHERELRLHEYMKMMGVNPMSHFFAWFIESAGFLLVTVVMLTIILKAGGILPKSDGFVLFVYLCDYGLSVLAISFLVSSFFDKTNIAGLSGSLIYVICFFPFIVLIHLEDNLSFSVKSALSLFSPTCFSYASQYISRYEKQEEGIQWSNMYVSPLAGDTSSFGWLCWLLLIDSLVYFIIGVYIRMVFPGKYGIGYPWYFPFTRAFWADVFSCCIKSPKKIGRGLLFTNMMQEHNSNDKSKGKSNGLANGEEDFSQLPVGVSLYGLTKTYDSRHAVDNLNLTFYQGHVTSLLGHNGAGKTTTMSLLTGLFSPTSGTIEVYGMDMQTFIDDVRKEMGVCMQYDVLFDHLTTKEHLLLYAQIKSPQWTKHEVNEQVRKTLKETGMYAHRHKRVGTLSGGMKRKLSISIAFIGGSRLVVLDEPTTGVDPCSRRSIWDIVLQHKQERTIILSTHHLDEAEVLSDRIAFLERGGLKCCGSPFYLKDKMAKGYNLTLTKRVQSLDSKEKFDGEQLKEFIQSYMPEAQQKEGDVGDLVYSLPPYSLQNAAAYQSLLTSLDQNLDKLQLGCYGISDTTLEEVFLQLTHDDMEPEVSSLHSVSESVVVTDMFASRDSIPDDLNSTYLGEKASLTGSSTVSGVALTAQRVMAMLLKRVHHSKRDWKGLFSQVLLPVFFVIAAMGLGSIKSDLQHFPEMELSPALYHVDEQYAFFSNQNPNSSSLVDIMMSYPGIDHFCMKDPSNPICIDRHNTEPQTWISKGNRSNTFSTCKCSNQMQSCPASGYDPPHMRNPSSQIVFNLTGITVENYLLSTANDFIRNRYGGWDFGSPLPVDLKMDMVDVPKNRTLAKVWYNSEGHHTAPAYINSLNNFLLRSSLPPEKRQKYAISVSSHPYPGQVQSEDVMVGSLVSILVALCVLTGYSIMTASFVIYEVQEHHSGSKRLQQISGISEPFYWILNFFYDMTLYMVPVLLSVVMVAAFQLSAFTDRNNLGAVTLLLVLFGFASFPWMYLMSAVFKDAEMAFIGYVCINLFISVNTIISTSIIYFLGQLNPNDLGVQNVYQTMSNVFLVFPQFSFGNGLMELTRLDMQVQILKGYGVDAYKDPFSMDVLGWMFISLFLQGFICFTLRLLLNKSLIRKVRRLICPKNNVVQSYSPNDDEDVIAERHRVERGAASADILQLNQLTKVYQQLKKRVPAVKTLSVGIPAGECFGLLGVNGAGKTTTFKMLTGDISPTDGSAKILDIDGRMVDIIDCRREGINIGYCPQVDALDDLLTGEEHLYFYSRIRGISKREIDRVVNYLLKKMELNYHRHNTSESYSCGTRRKLSTALALIGNPQILLLDEPSSGMDPRSKRHLWKIIQEQVMGKCAVVLTSHSMEECEALCTRLAIMVKGEFRCLGSLQHIKNRFGKGFTVKMYLAEASCDVDMISNFMEQNFPGVCLKDHHSNMVEYHVPVATGGVASIFNQLESNKAVLQIKHFSVSQTTLDEVFIDFAMGKADPDTQELTEGSDIDSLDSYNASDT